MGCVLCQQGQEQGSRFHQHDEKSNPIYGHSGTRYKKFSYIKTGANFTVAYFVNYISWIYVYKTNFTKGLIDLDTSFTLALTKAYTRNFQSGTTCFTVCFAACLCSAVLTLKEFTAYIFSFSFVVYVGEWSLDNWPAKRQNRNVSEKHKGELDSPGSNGGCDIPYIPGWSLLCRKEAVLCWKSCSLTGKTVNCCMY